MMHKKQIVVCCLCAVLILCGFCVNELRHKYERVEKKFSGNFLCNLSDEIIHTSLQYQDRNHVYVKLVRSDVAIKNENVYLEIDFSHKNGMHLSPVKLRRLRANDGVYDEKKEEKLMDISLADAGFGWVALIVRQQDIFEQADNQCVQHEIIPLLLMPIKNK